MGEPLSKNVPVVICTGFFDSSINCFSINGSDGSEIPSIPKNTIAIQITEIIAPIVKEGACKVCF